MGCKMIGSIVEDTSHGCVGTSHHPLHAINGTYVVALVDTLTATRTHEDVLVVVGHPHHFVGHHLTDGKDQVEAPLHQQSVYLCRPGEVQLPFRHFVDI